MYGNVSLCKGEILHLPSNCISSETSERGNIMEMKVYGAIHIIRIKSSKREDAVDGVQSLALS